MEAKMKKTYVTPNIEILDFANTACHIKTILGSNGEVIRTECDSHGANCSYLGLSNGSTNSANNNCTNNYSGGMFNWFWSWWH